MNTIAIIGTAGRKEDGKKLTKQMWDEMFVMASTMVAKFSLNDASTVLSGGAAWADHLAVKIYLNGNSSGLKLHLPAAWDSELNCYVEKGGKMDAGRTSNYYHGLFSNVIEVDTLRQISDTIDMGAEIRVGKGFFDRNALVAKDATHLIAFTFGEEAELKDGGTANTTAAYLKKVKDNNLIDNSYHIDLNTMLAYKGAIVK